MILAVKQYFKKKKVLVLRSINNASSIKFRFCNLHNSKMLYLLTQDSMQNRKFRPFFICNCSRGDGVRNNMTQKCAMMKNSDYKVKYERSKNARIRGDML